MLVKISGLIISCLTLVGTVVWADYPVHRENALFLRLLIESYLLAMAGDDRQPRFAHTQLREHLMDRSPSLNVGGWLLAIPKMPCFNATESSVGKPSPCDRSYVLQR